MPYRNSKIMPQKSNMDTEIKSGLTVASFCIFALLGVIVLGMWGCPKYRVYSARKEGEAILAHAQSSREVAVAEARAKMEAATLLAEADTIRAHGIAASNQIIGKSLENNPRYLQWLFLDQIKDSKNQIIYVPSGNMGIPILEANRLKGDPLNSGDEK
jgi:hypothetical protein